MLTFGTRKGGEASASPKMFITEDGNVGIGSSAPVGKLEVVGQDALRLVGYQPFLTLLDNNAGYARGRIQSASGDILFYPESFIGGTPAMTISSGSGNVGITGKETFGASTRQMITLYDSGLNSTFGIGVQSAVLYQRAGAGSGFAWYQGGSHADRTFDAGGGNTLMTLDGNGDLQVNAVNSSGGNAVWGNNPNGTGVAGTSSSGSGVYGGSTTGNAVFGYSSGGGLGVLGEATGQDGVRGITHGAGVNAGVHGIAPTVNEWAGFFDGPVGISTDLLVAGTKNFKIDHPLDPANKYLLHASIESPDVKNLYDGNITTDASGEAVVTLPTYFEVLNRDFRYQLTVLGQFAQAIVSSKIKGNQFTIKTDKPNVEVSWQVTGIRQDAYMKAHPMVVEQDKPTNERGTYQHPELFGQPEEKGLSWSQNPELWKRLKKERVEQAALPKP